MKTFLAVIVLFIALPGIYAQTLLKDTGRGLANVGKAAGRLTGKAAVQAGRATKTGGKKAAHYSARKVNQGTAKLEDKTK